MWRIRPDWCGTLSHPESVASPEGSILGPDGRCVTQAVPAEERKRGKIERRVESGRRASPRALVSGREFEGAPPLARGPRGSKPVRGASGVRLSAPAHQGIRIVLDLPHRIGDPIQTSDYDHNARSLDLRP